MSDGDLRISATELKRRMAGGEQFTILDVRNPDAWAHASDIAHGALRADLHAGYTALPRVPRNRSVVAYCT